MSGRRLIAVKCRLSKGVFASERAFEIRLANAQVHSGPVPLHFCWNAQGHLLRENEAVEDEVEGFLAARIVEELDCNQVAVEVPDGEVLAVRKDQIVSRPTPIHPPSAAGVS